MKFRFILIQLLLLTAFAGFTQNTANDTCVDSKVFCGDGTEVYLATYTLTPGGVPSEVGPDYGCLATHPNPAWFFMQIGDPGDITLRIGNHIPETVPPEDFDIDFICWGPFNSPTGACVDDLTAGKIVDCSYLPDHVEFCDIPNAQTGQFYLLLITNFSNQETEISFFQSNYGMPGAGNTNCNIVINCSILALSPVPTVCDEPTATFSISGSVEFTNPPTAAGSTLTITDVTAVPPIPVVFSTMPFTSPMPFTISNIPCDGLNHHLDAVFTNAPNPCTFSEGVLAPPAPCPVAVISGGGNICPGVQATVEINVTGAGGPFDFTYAIDGVNQTPVTGFNGPFPYPITTGTTGTYTLVSISNANCPGTVSGSATVTVVPFPPAPAPTGGTYYRCGSGTVDLSVTADPGTVINWYAAATGGTPLFTGNPFTTPAIASTTTYYAEAETVIAGCKSVTRIPVIAEIRPVPDVNPVSQTICSGDYSNITLTSTPAGATFSWNSTWNNPPGSIFCCPTVPGSGNFIHDQLVNSVNIQAFITYAIVPVLNQCTGNSYNVPVYVNPIVYPTFQSGPASVCMGTTGAVYVTQPGKTAYVWSVTGGTITGGGTSADNSVTVTWPVVGTGSVSVSYSDPVTLCAAGNPAVQNVEIKPLPSPVINGPVSACINSTGNLYSTETGMNNYTWTVNGGTYTFPGPGQDQISVTWNSAGNQTVSVNYTDPATQCAAAAPTVWNVTVHPLPVPLITSPAPVVCVGIPGNVYSTDALKTNYFWTVTGGSITAGGTAADNSVTVTWNTAGTGHVTVLYTEPTTQCTATAPVDFPVTVNALPDPDLTGIQTVCYNSSGNVYTTDALKNNYLWNITGGTVTSGGTTADNTVTVTWNTAGTGSVSVNYTDANGCTALSPASLAVMVNNLPAPTISGPSNDCLNNTTSYSTQAGQTNYIWNVTGGTFTPGASPEIINVTWNSTAGNSVSVIYADPITLCMPAAPVVNSVSVSTLPNPTITGPASICTGFTATYTTEPSHQNYLWTCSPGGTVTAGGTTADNTITVAWNTAGAQLITVNYSIGPSCTAPAPRSYPVTVNQATTPVVTASLNPLCEGASATYTTQAGMTGYAWTVPPAGTITAGGGTNQNFVSIRWDIPGNNDVSVNFTNGNGCTAAAVGFVTAGVNPLPDATVAGPASVCQDFPTPSSYQTVTIDPTASYSWQIISGTGTLSPSNTANPVNIAWSAPGGARIRVNATSAASCSASGTLDLTVNPKPAVSLTACFDPVTTRNAKAFHLKGFSPLFPPSATPQGEFLISPATPALGYDPGSGIYSFNPALVPGNATQTFALSYRYTNQFGCPNTSPSLILTVDPSNTAFACGSAFIDKRSTPTRSYTTAFIAGHCWMAENLAYGTNTAAGGQQTDNCTPERFTLTSDPTAINYGGFYQWDELMQYRDPASGNIQGLCPPGWHVPSEAEWQYLIDNADPLFPAPGANGTVGALFKDEFRPFQAKLAGIGYQGDNWYFTTGSLTVSMYWTSTLDPKGKPIARGINDPYNPSISWYPAGKSNAFSIRCVKD